YRFPASADQEPYCPRRGRRGGSPRGGLEAPAQPRGRLSQADRQPSRRGGPMRLPDWAWGVSRVWLRYYDVFTKSIIFYAVALIGVLTGDFAPVSLLTVLPVCFFSSLLFSGMGLASAAFARDIDQISYPQYLLVFPMFLFCGVFYPIEKMPYVLQLFAWSL